MLPKKPMSDVQQRNQAKENPKAAFESHARRQDWENRWMLGCLFLLVVGVGLAGWAFFRALLWLHTLLLHRG